MEAVAAVGLVGVEAGEPRCINLSALTRPLRPVTVAERPGGADMTLPSETESKWSIDDGDGEKKRVTKEGGYRMWSSGVIFLVQIQGLSTAKAEQMSRKVKETEQETGRNANLIEV